MPSDVVAWTAADGTRLAATVRGPADAPPVLCLPGLTRNSRDFDVLADALAAGPAPRRVIAMDFRGRGLSAYADPATYRPDVEAGDVTAGLDALGVAAADVIGTSRGGIVAMIIAVTAPDRLGRIVLNDIGPVIERGGLLAIRDRMGTMLAGGPSGWEDAVADLRATMGRRFTALTDADWHAFARQMYRTDGAGQPVLDYDPRLLDAFASFDPAVGIAPFWEAFEALAPRPLLIVRGENSDLLSEETLAEMARRHAGAAVWRVPREGHAPLLKDEPTIERIRRFLAA